MLLLSQRGRQRAAKDINSCLFLRGDSRRVRICAEITRCRGPNGDALSFDAAQWSTHADPRT